MRPMLVTALALSILAFAGCARTPGGITASNIPLEQGGYVPLTHVATSDCKVNLFGFIPVSGGNHIEDAVKKAQRKGGGDALVNISVDLVSKHFLLWSQLCTEVRATAVRIS